LGAVREVLVHIFLAVLGLLVGDSAFMDFETSVLAVVVALTQVA
jgi:hypothetical protein